MAMNPRLLVPRATLDADAAAYLRAVEAADGQALETPVKRAVDDFIKGMKADSAGYAGDPTRTVWDAMKSACIMCGARTLAGALVSLKSYGDELVDIDNLPTPTISDGGGSVGEWVAASRTMLSTQVGTSNNFPRFSFYFPAVKAGNVVRVTGRVSGDYSSVTILRLFGVNYTVSADGSFDIVTTSTGSEYVVFYIDSRFSTKSITIESLSIKEYFANPTNVANNFVSSDYSRTTGLVGDGATKYLDSKRAGDADGQNDKHIGVYITTNPVANGKALAGGYNAAGTAGTQLVVSGGILQASINAATTPSTLQSVVASFAGASREDSSTINWRVSGQQGQLSLNSVAVGPETTYVFGRNFSTPILSDARLAFYSIGSALDLAALDNRVSTLVAAIAAAL